LAQAVDSGDLHPLVRVWFDDLFTRGDLDAVERAVTESFVAHAQGGAGATEGRERFRDWLRWYTGTFVDREWRVEEVIEAGDRLVVRYTGRTTYAGGWHPAAATGRRVTETGILIFRLAGEQAAELWAEMSDLQVAAQLGVVDLTDAAGGV
jgi:predicted ester cyclase